MKTQEVWKDVLGYEGLYQVSDQGRVKSLARTTAHCRRRKERILKTTRHGFGYRTVNFQVDYKRIWVTVHKLVLEAFIGERPEGMECRHLDGNPENNRLINLQWGTAKENQADRVSHGTDMRGEQHTKSKLCELDVWLIRNCNGSQQKIADFLGVSQTLVSKIRRRVLWAHI